MGKPRQTQRYKSLSYNKVLSRIPQLRSGLKLLVVDHTMFSGCQQLKTFITSKFPRCDLQVARIRANQSDYPTAATSIPQSTQFRRITTGVEPRRKRLVVAVTGATGSPLAVSLLKRLRQANVETHLILSTWAVATLKYELDAPKDTASYLSSLASCTYSPKDVSASLSSGSFPTDGMIIVPCSMKTLAAVRMGYDNDLITRAASVTLKERRRLVLVARETPLSSIHLENMLKLSDAGAVIMPPVMAFYTRPKGILDMVDQSVKRMIDMLGIQENVSIEDETKRLDVWTGFDWSRKNHDQ